MSELFDVRGCLTDEALVALGGAATGAAPPELAQHVAACARCQDRWLKSSTPQASRPRITAEETARRRWVMTAIVLGVLLFALAALVWTLRYLSGG